MKKPYISLIHKAFYLFSRFPFLGLGAENGTRTRDLNLGKVALYQLSYFRKYLLLIASAKVTKICESPNFSVPFCNFFTITEPQDKSNRPPPASHTAYYQSDILHSEIKRTKSSGQSSRLSVPAIDIRKGVELHPDTASALRNPHQYPKRPTIFRAGSSTKKQGSSILIVRTQYRA